jgi:hypothetical protein
MQHRVARYEFKVGHISAVKIAKQVKKLTALHYILEPGFRVKNPMPTCATHWASRSSIEPTLEHKPLSNRQRHDPFFENTLQ